MKTEDLLLLFSADAVRLLSKMDLWTGMRSQLWALMAGRTDYAEAPAEP